MNFVDPSGHAANNRFSVISHGGLAGGFGAGKNNASNSSINNVAPLQTSAGASASIGGGNNNSPKIASDESEKIKNTGTTLDILASTIQGPVSTNNIPDHVMQETCDFLKTDAGQDMALGTAVITLSGLISPLAWGLSLVMGSVGGVTGMLDAEENGEDLAQGFATGFKDNAILGTEIGACFSWGTKLLKMGLSGGKLLGAEAAGETVIEQIGSLLRGESWSVKGFVANFALNMGIGKVSEIPGKVLKKIGTFVDPYVKKVNDFVRPYTAPIDDFLRPHIDNVKKNWDEWVKKFTGGRLSKERISFYLNHSLNNNDSNITILGLTGTYDEIGEAKGYSYFKMSKELWSQLQDEAMENYDEMWKVNKQFIDDQREAGNKILLSNDPHQGYYFENGQKRFYQRELDYLKNLGYSFKSIGDNLWEAIK